MNAIQAANAINAINALDLGAIKTKLMHRASGEGWSAAHADAVEIEYRRFLTLMKLYPNESTAPVVDVDTFWHYHILDTAKYAADCDQAFGYFLHHYPYLGLEDDDAAQRDTAGARMQELYAATFGAGTAAAQTAAWCGAATNGPAATTAWCGAATSQSATAWCGAATPQSATAWCGAATAQPATAWCGASTGTPAQQATAWCGATVVPTGKQAVAWCGAAQPVDKTVAWCGAARPVQLRVNADLTLTITQAA